MKQILILSLFYFSLNNAVAQNTDSLFEKAKIAYDDNKFNESLKYYLLIDFQNIESFELYYNIGNCYYKLNNIAKAIQYYSKSLKIEPNNIDAKNNLKFAYLKTRDKIEPKEELFLNRWWKSIYNSNTSNNWAWITLTIFTFFSCTITIFLLAQSERKRKFFFFTSVILFLLTFSTYLFSYAQYKFSCSQNEAVILNNSVSIKSAPTVNATNLFVLHEGTVVQIIEQNENWFRIQLDNQKEGWVNNENIATI